MKIKDILDKVSEMCIIIADKYCVNFIDAEYKKEGKNYILRIIIDKKEGIAIEDCENFSRELSLLLDEDDFIQNSYYLEVQSPGERILKKESDYKYFKDRYVEVKLFEEINSKKIYLGHLIELKDNIISIQEDNGDVIKFDIKNTAYVKLKIVI